MARPFSYNPSGATISGCIQVGDIAVGVANQDYYAKPGGIQWWNGPDETIGYIVAKPAPSGNQPNSINRITGNGQTASIGFNRSVEKTEQSFLDLVVVVFGQTFGNGDDAKSWLETNGYWTSYASFIKSNLVLHYDPSDSSSYSGSGNTLNDLSGNGITGTMSNITYTNPYFSYNGSSSQVRIEDNALLEPGSGNWTIEVWFYVNSFSSSSVVLGKFDDGGLAQDVSYSIRINTLGNIFAQYSNGSPSAFVNSTSYSLSLNTWYQVVYVWTNSGLTKTIETFINGVSIGTTNHSFNSILNSANPLYLGSYNGGEYSQWLNGRIGVTRIYNSALTSSQVLQNYNADKNKYGL